MNTEKTEFYTVREVAEILCLSVPTVYKKCREGKIGYSDFWGNIRIKKSTVETIKKENHIPKIRKQRVSAF